MNKTISILAFVFVVAIGTVGLVAAELPSSIESKTDFTTYITTWDGTTQQMLDSLKYACVNSYNNDGSELKTRFVKSESFDWSTLDCNEDTGICTVDVTGVYAGCNKVVKTYVGEWVSPYTGKVYPRYRSTVTSLWSVQNFQMDEYSYGTIYYSSYATPGITFPLV